jgi:hypothetical protein
MENSDISRLPLAHLRNLLDRWLQLIGTAAPAELKTGRKNLSEKASARPARTYSFAGSSRRNNQFVI